MMCKLRDKLFRWLLKKYIVQGRCKINFVMTEIKKACREEYYEDNDPTLKNYIQCALDKSFGTKQNYGITWHERQLEEEKAKSRALLVGLEVQNVEEFISKADVENYKQIGENITIGFKALLKDKGTKK